MLLRRFCSISGLIIALPLFIACPPPSGPETKRPNLSISLSLPAGTILEGETFSVGVTVLNGGNAASPATEAVISLSDDALSDPSDTVVGTVPVPALGPGESHSVPSAAPVSIPAAGTYYIIGTIDPDDTVEESDETDNTAVEQVTISALANLVPGRVTVSDPYVADGTSPVVSVTISNTGTLSTDTGFSVEFYMSADSTFDTGTDTFMGSTTVAAVAGLSDVTVSDFTTLAIADDLNINANRYLYAVADSADEIPESDETDNISAVGDAAVILVYNNEDDFRTYNLIVETYPSTPTSATNAPDTFMHIYNASMTELYSEDSGGIGSFAAITTVSVPAGTYYVLVYGFSTGSYGTMVRSSNIDTAYFDAELTGESEDPVQGDDTTPPDEPAVYYSLKAGEAVNRYLGSSDLDWFRVVLP